MACRHRRALATFPRLGPALEGRWRGFRSILGPWPWMLIVYVHDEEEDLVIVATIQDARSGRAPRSGR
jgi:plasmid stabilization system protein ParE